MQLLIIIKRRWKNRETKVLAVAATSYKISTKCQALFPVIFLHYLILEAWCMKFMHSGESPSARSVPSHSPGALGVCSTDSLGPLPGDMVGTATEVEEGMH